MLPVDQSTNLCRSRRDSGARRSDFSSGTWNITSRSRCIPGARRYGFLCSNIKAFGRSRRLIPGA